MRFHPQNLFTHTPFLGRAEGARSALPSESATSEDRSRSRSDRGPELFDAWASADAPRRSCRTMLGRTVMTVGRRHMSGVAKTAAGGEVMAWRPKIQVTRHLSPFEMEIITPPQKWLNYQKNAFIENAPDW